MPKLLTWRFHSYFPRGHNPEVLTLPADAVNAHADSRGNASSGRPLVYHYGAPPRRFEGPVATGDLPGAVPGITEADEASRLAGLGLPSYQAEQPALREWMAQRQSQMAAYNNDTGTPALHNVNTAAGE